MAEHGKIPSTINDTSLHSQLMKLCQVTRQIQLNSSIVIVKMSETLLMFHTYMWLPEHHTGFVVIFSKRI